MGFKCKNEDFICIDSYLFEKKNENKFKNFYDIIKFLPIIFILIIFYFLFIWMIKTGGDF